MFCGLTVSDFAWLESIFCIRKHRTFTTCTYTQTLLLHTYLPECYEIYTLGVEPYKTFQNPASLKYKTCPMHTLISHLTLIRIIKISLWNTYKIWFSPKMSLSICLNVTKFMILLNTFHLARFKRKCVFKTSTNNTMYSLIRVSDVHSTTIYITLKSNDSISGQRRLRSVCAYAQTDLSRRCLQVSEDAFSFRVAQYIVCSLNTL